MKHVFHHVGDLGDIVAALPAIKAMGGGCLLVSYRHNGQRESLAGARFEALVPLLLAQPYISGVRWAPPPEGCIDFANFRSMPDHGRNLARWQADYVNVDIDPAIPWLTVKPEPHGRPVLARSPRYHNPDFPWREIVGKLVNPLFVGLPAEHAAFCRFIGRDIEHQPTRTMLDMARIIAGASIFVGNQSSPWWTAAGLGVKCVQETHPIITNSVIHRPGAEYPMFNGYDISRMIL